MNGFLGAIVGAAIVTGLSACSRLNASDPAARGDTNGLYCCGAVLGGSALGAKGLPLLIGIPATDGVAGPNTALPAFQAPLLTEEFNEGCGAGCVACW